jgi:hypothetical protein
MSSSDEFFIGYEPVPPRVGRRLSRIAVAAATSAALGGAALTAGHVRLEGGTFAFGDARTITGAPAATPYPALRLEGDSGPAAVLLVAAGKHGVDAGVADAARVTAMASRIKRGDAVMMEVVPGSASQAGTRSAVRQTDDGRPVTLVGEIVDSKCFLGVMVPGDGTTHRDCASLCIRGGVPPAFYVQDREGNSALLLLTGTAPAAVREQAVRLAGSAVEISGRVTRQAGWLVLQSNPASWRALQR